MVRDPLATLEHTYIHASILSGMGWSLMVNGKKIYCDELADHMRIALLVLGYVPDDLPADRLKWLRENGNPQDAEQYESFLDCID
jgi:hypothetical protein